jgi:hypothetical protein
MVPAVAIEDRRGGTAVEVSRVRAAAELASAIVLQNVELQNVEL